MKYKNFRQNKSESFKGCYMFMNLIIYNSYDSSSQLFLPIFRFRQLKHIEQPVDHSLHFI